MQDTAHRRGEPGQIPVRTPLKKIEFFITFGDLPCKRTCHGKGLMTKNIRNIDHKKLGLGFDILYILIYNNSFNSISIWNQHKSALTVEACVQPDEPDEQPAFNQMNSRRYIRPITAPISKRVSRTQIWQRLRHINGHLWSQEDLNQQHGKHPRGEAK